MIGFENYARLLVLAMTYNAYGREEELHPASPLVLNLQGAYLNLDKTAGNLTAWSRIMFLPWYRFMNLPERRCINNFQIK